MLERGFVCLSTDWTVPPRPLTTPVHGAASQMCHPLVPQAASSWTREGVSLRRLWILGINCVKGLYNGN